MKLPYDISSASPQGGGPIEGVKQFYQPLVAVSVMVEIVCCDTHRSPWSVGNKLPVTHTLGPCKFGYSYKPGLLSWLQVNASRFDVVIINGLWQYSGLAVRKALVNTEIPYFVFTHGMLDLWFKRAYPRKHLKKNGRIGRGLNTASTRQLPLTALPARLPLMLL